ncbi:MAG: bifunctional glycosyltransferase/class I SAM-dependent methyltransferase [Acidimicrobiia bacterium]
MLGGPVKRIGILVVAYNAASTLASVLDRIPSDFMPRISKVMVNDDCSADPTYLVGLGYRQLHAHVPLEIIRHDVNLGYGGNQKAGYNWAIEQGLDIVVLLHGDGQYPPEMLADIVDPIERGECEAVFGSRMLVPGEARKGGMPYYKYIGNRILTGFQNGVVGTDLSEWHSGYRAYSVEALKRVPFNDNVDGFAFDTQIILQFHEAGQRMKEIPIPTYYGDEICYVNGMKYAKDVVKDVLRYRAHKAGLGTGETAFASHQEYEQKVGDDTSHARIVQWLERRPASKILDLGCADGRLGERLRTLGHTVVGVDLSEAEGVAGRLDAFVQANLDQGIPDEVGDGVDIVLAAEVLEHVRDPGGLLEQARARLNQNASVIVSVPNFAHWYPRSRVALGRFDYDQRGILDRDHVRFFTRKSFERLLESAGFAVRRSATVGVPIETARLEGEADDQGLGIAGNAQRIAVELWPTMFGFQFLYELEAVAVPKQTSAAPAVGAAPAAPPQVA